MNLLIINYHYFRNCTYKSGIYPVNDIFFLNQIKLVKKYYSFIGQNEIIKLIKTKKKIEGNFCLITFDDGLKEQMKAYKILQKNNIPAIFFTPTKPIIENCVLDVHKIHFVRSRFENKEIIKLIKEKFGCELTKDKIELSKKQYRYDDHDTQKLKYLLNFDLNNKEKKIIINHFFKKLCHNESSFSKKLYMNHDEIRELSKNNMLGNHGHSHQPMSKMNNQDLFYDIQKSTDFLSNITGKMPRSFSYPYGSDAAISPKISKYIKNAGYEFGLTMKRGLNYSFKNRFFLKRIDTNDAISGQTEMKNLFK